nr:meiotic recombination protein spo11-1 [Quercus suber]
MSTSKEAMISKIEAVFGHIAEDIVNERDHISITLRRRGANASTCDSNVRQLTFPGKNAEDAWRFALRKDVVMSKRYSFGSREGTAKEQRTYSPRRDIYYRDPALFGAQAPVDRYVDDIVCTFGASRSSLNVSAAAKGLIAGPITFRGRNGSSSANSNDTEGLLVPDLREILSVELSAAKWILVIEKEATFRAIASSDFWKLDPQQGVIITGKGYPDVGTRALLRLLSTPSPRNNFASPPVFGLVDFDPDGLAILSTFKYGSVALAHESDQLRVPSLQWIGLQSKHLLMNNASTHANQGLLILSSRDRRKAQKLLERQASFPAESGTVEWRSQLQHMLMLSIKAEIQLLHVTSDSLTNLLNRELSGF